MIETIARQFGGLCPVYADDVPQGARDPCVCVRILEERQTPRPGGVLERYVECAVTLYGVPIAEAERLRVLPVGRACRFQIEGACVRVAYRLRVPPAASGNLMKELVLQ